MRENKPQKSAIPPWRVPVAIDDIAPTGGHFDLAADSAVRAEVARIAGLRDLPRLEAKFDVMRHSENGPHVIGVVSATVGQSCVVTLEPLSHDVEEAVDLVFVPQAIPAPGDGDVKAEPRNAKWDDPEPLIGGALDLGALATEFLLLGLDPYPRKPGVVFEAPQDGTPDEGPFAALAKLTKGESGP